VINASIPPSNLAKAQSVVKGIQNDYTCQQANADLAKWVADKPTKKFTIKKEKIHGHIKRVKVPVKYRAKPVVPPFCSTTGGSA
jgi:hypothetical protein